MNRLLLAGLILICAGLLSACGRSAITPRAHTATPVPELNVTRPSATARPSLMATDAPASPTPPTLTPTPTLTPAPTLTPSPVVTRVRPSPTSSGPLSVAVYVASCRRAPSPGKPGNVIVQISIEATGGSGNFHYFNEGVESPTKFVDITWERGTRLIGTVRVESGDGQTVRKEYDIPTGELTCQ
ncbi:MAG: hypothetical protein HY870_10955, partial [Chloroflexi bacterium]|nr:hypothetical protein [Chloroflexota bacterium]